MKEKRYVNFFQLTNTTGPKDEKIKRLEQKNDEQFRVVFDAIRALMTPLEPKKKEIEFHVQEKKAKYGSNLDKGKGIG